MDPDQAAAREYSQAREAEDDEDDAWALDSDDEEFALRQQRLGAPAAHAALPRPSRTVSGSSTFTHASTSRTATPPSSGRKHAPPARPHPFPLPTTPALQASRSNSSPVPVSQQPRPQQQQRTSSIYSSSIPRSDYSSDWTEVRHSSDQDSIDPALAGSPPTDVGSTAVEAVLQACLSDQQPTQHREPSSEQSRISPSHAVGLDRTKDKQSQWYSSVIRPRVLDIVHDPFVALQDLATSKTDTTRSASVGDSLPPTPLVTPNTAIRRQQEHTQNLGRGFNEINGGSTPLTSPGTAGSGNFDPISMAGEGVMMSGSKWGNSTTSLQQQQQKQSHLSVQDDQTADSSSDVPLKRARSVRTRRRWREFLRSLKCDITDDDEWQQSQSNAVVDLAKLRESSWNGIPSELRPIVWPLLLGYMPAHSSMRSSTLSRKRQDYRKAVQLAFGYDAFADDADDCPRTPTSASAAANSRDRTKAIQKSEGGPESTSRPHTPVAGKKRGSDEEKLWHQISIDVPRTNPGLPLWQRSSTQRSLERLLYVWAIRHHATGYVQGMSDLATPFFQVFLSIYLTKDTAVEEYDIAALPVEARIAIEADTYWCLGKLLDGIQENYIFAQPGITRQVRRMEELVGRIDAPLHAHLKSQQVEYIQFAFRWMNCLLMREMSVRNVTRLWDTYLAEGPDAFSDFHLYVCSVFLCKWSEKLREMDFQVSVGQTRR